MYNKNNKNIHRRKRHVEKKSDNFGHLTFPQIRKSKHYTGFVKHLVLHLYNVAKLKKCWKI